MRAVILAMLLLLVTFSAGFAQPEESSPTILAGFLQTISNEGERPTHYLYSGDKLFRLLTTNPSIPFYGFAQLRGYFLHHLEEEIFQVESVTQPVQSAAQIREVSTGKQRTLVVLTKFSDVNATPNPPGHYRSLVFEKMNEYYLEASFSQISFEGDVLGWFSLPRSFEYYVETGRWGAWAQDAVTVIDDSVTFSDNMRLILVGNRNFRARGTVGFWQLRTGEGTVKLSISWIAPDDKVGVYAHEMGHNLGLPDLYDVDEKEVYLGKWDTMAEGAWNNAGESPAHFSSWSKIKLGWIPTARVFNMVYGDENLTRLDLVELLSSSYQAVKLPVGNDRYYLVETRKKIGYDAFLPDEGVLVTYIDETIPDGKGPVRAVDSTPSTQSLDDATFDVRSNKQKTWLSQDKLTQLDVVDIAAQSYTVKIFYGDRIVIDRFKVEKSRVDIGSTQNIFVHAYWARNQSDAVNIIVAAGGRQGITNKTGWASIGVSSSSSGRQDYPADSVNLTTGTIVRFLQENIPTLTWDRVLVKLSVPRPRVDVGSEAEIKVEATYEFDGAPFTGKVTLSDEKQKLRVGSYSYNVASVADQLYGLSSFQSNEVSVIFDKVRITLSTPRDRISVGETTNVTASAAYIFDGKPFSGVVSLSEDLQKNSVGKFNYMVRSITDREHGISAFESNVISVIFDRVMVNLKAPRTRIGAGSEAPITSEAFHEYDRQEFRGEISLNHPRVIDNVGEVKYRAAAIVDRSYGIRAFTSNELTISFDRVAVTLAAKSPRLQVGKDASITWQAVYELDNAPFNGKVVLNEETRKNQIGRYSYRGQSINDPVHGLASFKTNELTVTFDEIHAKLSMDSLLPFSSKLSVYLRYLSDDAPVDNAHVFLDKVALKNLGSGAYELTITTVSPYLSFSINFVREDFEPQSIASATLAVGNTALFTAFSGVLILTFAVRARHKRKRRLLIADN